MRHFEYNINVTDGVVPRYEESQWFEKAIGGFGSYLTKPQTIA